MTEPVVPSAGDGGLVRLRLDLSYDGTDFCGLGRATRPAVPCRPSSRRACSACCGWTPPRAPWSPVAPTPGSTPAARSATSTCRGPRSTPSGVDGPAAPARGGASRGRRRPGGRPRPRRLRGALRGLVAALRLPRRRRSDGPRPAAPARGAAPPAAAGRRAAQPVRRSRCSASTTSRPSAGGGQGRAPYARCSTSGGRGTTTGCSSRPSGPTRSATRWCGRWSASCCPWVRGGVRWAGRRRSWLARVRDPLVTVAPARGLTLEEVAYPPDDRAGASRVAGARSTAADRVAPSVGRSPYGGSEHGSEGV